MLLLCFSNWSSIREGNKGFFNDLEFTINKYIVSNDDEYWEEKIKIGREKMIVKSSQVVNEGLCDTVVFDYQLDETIVKSLRSSKEKFHRLTKEVLIRVKCKERGLLDRQN